MDFKKFRHSGKYVRKFLKRIGDLSEVEDPHIDIMGSFGINAYDPVTKNVGSGVYA